VTLFSRLKLRTKLLLLLGLSTLAVVTSIAVSASFMHQRMIDDRIDKVHSIVLASIGFAQSLQARVDAHQISQEQAIATFRDEVHRMRFGAEDDYLLVQTYDGTVVMHGGDPKREGKMTASKDSRGRLTGELIRDIFATADGGVIWYQALKPGKAAPQDKVSYVRRYAPWQMAFIAGAWVDDLEVAYRTRLLQLGMVGGGILGVTLLAAWLVNRDITHSLGDLRGAMGRLAHGDLATDVPGTTRRDEVGDMAQAVLVFREQMVERSQLAAEQVDGQRAAEEKRAALIHMADSIEAATEAALEQIRQRIVVMTATADKMTASADRTGVAAGTASTAAANALSNAQTVASAAEQLTASIREIGGQVNRSSQVVSQAVAAGAETRATIEALNQQVEQIGAVANMIGEIAARTNLLALNATIEAARAGDAGKGFAVVASEVKALANQTARSTQEISRHIGLVRSATGASVSAVLRIEQTITDISAIAGSIAAAVEQQSATTAEIARNVVETAATATEMTTRTSEVSSEAGQTSHHAEAVRDNASGLNAAMGDLRHSLIRVVRTATSDVDRRIHRRFDVDLPARLTAAGQSCEVRVIDLSDGGARVRGMTALQVGERGTLDIKGVGFPLPVVVNRCDDDILRLTFVLDEAMAARLSGTAERLAQRQAA